MQTLTLSSGITLTGRRAAILNEARIRYARAQASKAAARAEELQKLFVQETDQDVALEHLDSAIAAEEKAQRMTDHADNINKGE